MPYSLGFLAADRQDRLRLQQYPITHACHPDCVVAVWGGMFDRCGLPCPQLADLCKEQARHMLNNRLEYDQALKVITRGMQVPRSHNPNHTPPSPRTGKAVGASSPWRGCAMGPSAPSSVNVLFLRPQALEAHPWASMSGSLMALAIHCLANLKRDEQVRTRPYTATSSIEGRRSLNRRLEACSPCMFSR